nr:unnamed protein product [Spirometra erinaceieuropaei]
MGEDGIKLLQQRLAERTREHKATREAALENKFRKLAAPMSSKNDKLVHNLSSKELTEEQMQVLRHEASFNTADAKPANMIAAVESILSQTEATDETKNLIRHQVSSLLMAHRPREVLSKVERDALKELRADNDLVIVPADKGRSTVVLDRTDYNQKAKSLLEDRQSYVPCESNPMKTLTREINATLLAMENSGAISPVDRRMARAQETALARFYGLPKVHKEGVPLRPIVSLKGTPTYGLAKWLFQRLKFLTSDSNTTVNSSTQFLEKLKGLLKFCLKTYFTFDGTIYEQVKGTPMGSPISGLLAEAVLQRLESLVFRHHRPKFWARYVDDTFVVIEQDQVLTFKEQLNAVFPDIQFTMEEEENNQLAFLDVLVCRKDCGGLKTKVFRKATNTTQILNFNSNHPISRKRSCTPNLGPGSFETTSFVESLSDKTNAHRGRFLAAERFPSKPGERIYWESTRTLPPDVKNQVSPNSYENKPLHKRIVVRGRKKAPFLSSVPRTPCDNLLGPMNYTGPGRYVLQGPSYSSHVPAATFAFNSKSRARMSLPQAVLLE